MWIKDELVRHLTSGPQGWSITITYQTVFRSISRLLTGIIWSITCTRPLVAGMSPITWATPLTTTCSCVTVTNECCFEPKPSTRVLSWERGEEACGWKSPIMVSLQDVNEGVPLFYSGTRRNFFKVERVFVQLPSFLEKNGRGPPFYSSWGERVALPRSSRNHSILQSWNHSVV